MALSVADWQARRDALVAARTTGTRSLSFGDGSRVEYSSDAELAAAIAFCDRELAAMQGVTRPGRFYFNTSKGL